LGVLTKIDMIKNQKTDYLEKMLDGSEYKLGHGYCAVILSNDMDIEKGITVEDKILLEDEYFRKNKNIKPSGVRTLRKMISDIQVKKIIEFIPGILVDINNQIDCLKNSSNFLNNLMGDDHKKLSVNLKIMIEKLVGSSQERAEFEDDLRKRLEKEIRECLQNDLFEEKSKLEHYQNTVDSNISNLFRKIDARNLGTDFKQLFSYGIKSSVFINNENLKKAYNKELILGLTLSLVKPSIDDNLGTKRNNWNRLLVSYINKLLKDDNIHKIIKSVTNNLLLEYIYRDVEFDDPISRKFAEYMIDEISNEAFESKIKYSIIAMLNLEKRPCVFFI